MKRYNSQDNDYLAAGDFPKELASGLSLCLSLKTYKLYKVSLLASCGLLLCWGLHGNILSTG